MTLCDKSCDNIAKNGNHVLHDRAMLWLRYLPILPNIFKYLQIFLKELSMILSRSLKHSNNFVSHCNSSLENDFATLDDWRKAMDQIFMSAKEDHIFFLKARNMN